MKARAIIVGVLCLASVVADSGVPAAAKMEPGLKARFVPHTMQVDWNLQLITGKIRVWNNKPRPPFRADFIVCTLAVYNKNGVDITGGKATDGGWHATGSIARGSSKKLRYQVYWQWGRRPHHIAIRRCFTPLT
jgi:hypothetical protein